MVVRKGVTAWLRTCSGWVGEKLAGKSDMETKPGNRGMMSPRGRGILGKRGSRLGRVGLMAEKLMQTKCFK